MEVEPEKKVEFEEIEESKDVSRKRLTGTSFARVNTILA